MNKINLRWIRTAGLTGALACTSVLTSCSLPQGVTWNDVRARGLIPVFMNRQPSTVAPQAPDDPIRVREIVRPQIADAPYATPVPERAGYVFSPFTKPERVVDVRSFSTGEEVRCPYTMQAFLVPNFNPVIAKKDPAPAKMKPVEVVSNDPDSISIKDIKPQEEQTTAPEQAPADLPYGLRVEGRPGFVYSPYAARNQLVDVAGIAPGVEVKCPYSGRLFRVPEPLPEEIAATPPAPATPETPPTADAPPAPAPSTPASVPAPAPAEEQLPTAKWSRKDQGLVQSPFGNEGQLVDVTGKAAGARVICPFTGKSFLVPSAE